MPYIIIIPYLTCTSQLPIITLVLRHVTPIIFCGTNIVFPLIFLTVYTSQILTPQPPSAHISDICTDTLYTARLNTWHCGYSIMLWWCKCVHTLYTPNCSGERVNSDIMTVQAVEMENTLGPLSDIRITFRSLNIVSAWIWSAPAFLCFMHV